MAAPAERNGNSHRDPKAESQVEEDGQQNKDNDAALNTVLTKHSNAIADIDALIREGHELKAVRRFRLRDKFVNLIGDVEQIFVAGPFDLDNHRRPTIDLAKRCHIIEVVADFA